MFTSIKELCSRLNKASVDFQGTSLHANITSLVQEVIRVVFICQIFSMACLNTKFYIFFQLFHSVSPEVVQCISTVKIAQVCHPFPYLVGQCTSTFVLVIGSLSLRKPLHLTYWISGGTSSLVCLSSKTSDTYRN